MSANFDVILVKANWCGHCKHFEPIFENTKKYFKENKSTINFKSFDFANESVKNDFDKEYGAFSQYIDGFPTIFIKYEKDNDVKYTTVEPSKQDINVEESLRLRKATKEFANNIIKGSKSFTNINNSQKGGKKQTSLPHDDNSINKVGGSYENMLEKSLKKQLSDLYYKRKYIKFKTKYLKLKEELK